jgi:calcineurin-like phosphoesterase family protein
MNFYIADTHFGHANILRLSNRPFPDIESMDRAICDNWNAKVSPNDVVYIAGDFAYKSETNPVAILKSLNGIKILIEGNHDKKNLKNPLFRQCFDHIGQLVSITDEGKRIEICHYPLIEWNGYFRDSYLVYGHIHNNVENRAFQIMKDEPRALNAGVDIIGFAPVTFPELIEANRKFQEAIPR